MQNERTEGRSRPACARHPPRARADRTTACAARWTDDCGSGETFSALAYTAKGCCITPNILPGDFLSPRACGPVECGGLQRAKIRRLRARGPRKSARISRPRKGQCAARIPGQPVETLSAAGAVKSQRLVTGYFPWCSHATGWSSLPTQSVGVIRSDKLFDASIKFLCTPRFPQQWAWGRIIGSLFSGVAGDVEDLEAGAHLCRAAREFPAVNARHTNVGNYKR